MKTQHLPLEKNSPILGISWKDRVFNAEVLSRAGLPNMYTLPRQRRLCWLGHVHRMNDSRVPKDILYGELASGKITTTGRPQLRYKDVCMRDMKALDIDAASWEGLAADRTRWTNQHLKTGEEKLMNAAKDKRICRKERSNSSRPETTLRCNLCGRVCLSRINLFSHRRRCSSRADSQNSWDASPMVSHDLTTYAIYIYIYIYIIYIYIYIYIYIHIYIYIYIYIIYIYIYTYI